MKNFLKENWFKLSIIILLIVFFGICFYWFGVRPSKMVRQCSGYKTDFISCLAGKGYIFQISNNANNFKF